MRKQSLILYSNALPSKTGRYQPPGNIPQKERSESDDKTNITVVSILEVE